MGCRQLAAGAHRARKPALRTPLGTRLSAIMTEVIADGEPVSPQQRQPNPGRCRLQGVRQRQARSPRRTDCTARAEGPLRQEGRPVTHTPAMEWNDHDRGPQADAE